MTAILESLGGIGLFLFGMAVMSSGLRKLAGARLRGWLSKSTQNPVAGPINGNICPNLNIDIITCSFWITTYIYNNVITRIITG